MWLLPVVAGAIVPHAPLLLPELESPEVAESAATIREAIDSLSLDGADVIVLLSPHAGHGGVYEEVVGDLTSFGIPDIEGKFETDEALLTSLDLPVIHGGVDHGILIPALLARWDVPIVAVGIDEAVDLQPVDEVRVAVVASINGSAGLSRRAPLTEVDGAVEAEERFLAALLDDVGSARDVALPGSCGGAVMDIFASVFEGRSARVHAHEVPVGVGYVVAEVA